MKHYIISKFNKEYNWRNNLKDIKELFEHALELNGINNVILKESNSNKENRFDLMIEMILTHDGLHNWDVSKVHSDWKTIYGKYIENKIIFDCEE